MKRTADAHFVSRSYYLEFLADFFDHGKNLFQLLLFQPRVHHRPDLPRLRLLYGRDQRRDEAVIANYNSHLQELIGPVLANRQLDSPAAVRYITSVWPPPNP